MSNVLDNNYTKSLECLDGLMFTLFSNEWLQYVECVSEWYKLTISLNIQNVANKNMFAVRMLLPTSDCMICWRTQIQKIIAIPGLWQ